MIPSFEICSKIILSSIRTVDVSKYMSIQLINAKEVHSCPNFEHAIQIPMYNGYTFFYPHDLKHHIYVLNGHNIELPTDTIEHFYAALYKTLHDEYTKAILEELP